MNKSTKVLITILISFGLYFIFDDILFKDIRRWFFDLTNQLGTSHIISYLITGVPLFIGTLLIGKKTDFFQNLGLDKSIIKGFLFALVCTLPMYIGFSILFEFNANIKINTILIGVVAAGFFEELYYRGFLFGLPFRKTKLGFILSIFFGALYFGLLHLYQSTEFNELLGIFLITFLGGILFAWVYAEWNFNIWVPVFLHMLMNLAWELFSVSDNALGGFYANVFRFVTIGLVIILTVLYKKRNGIDLTVNKKALLIQK
ncbi:MULTISPECIES: CPBP family intramembrane glutamic endopeptidase [Aequorivita]|uniref:Type II CAAX endopeptidase family protein n=2 Tax=Aequorivita TaxID=153265 RepID=A0AB35YUH6_9FLAO|nr:type II CAAX endopeptidase family protein [Aequorivita sp. Ant34-E75]WGF93972.1 type II CAAX endopeptidase family protein [Aequorivita sp. Ant34-E75]